MVKNYSSKLSGQIGENIVVAELGRRGIVATAFAGNVPEIDLLAYKDGKSIPIQIKSLKDGSLRTRADYYLNIHFDGKIQTIFTFEKASERCQNHRNYKRTNKRKQLFQITFPLK